MTTSAPTTTSAKKTTIDTIVYLVRGERIATVARTVVLPASSSGSRADVIAAQIAALAQGPTSDETALGFSSAVPAVTMVRSIAITDTTANIDLSSGFASGGGSLSMTLRWTQLVYTVTSNTGIAGVSLSIDGQPTTALGGEGLMIGSPQTRADLELTDAVPLILVESPLPFAAISSPLHLTGSSNTFEATARILVTASDGTVMLDTNFMASCGTGCRGTFDERFSLSSKSAGPATVTVYESSPKDGEPINVVTFPVTVT
ncbi:MAG: Gmad2 immunoglobulin-like domain-containing protein [Acidimicrobiia bacterium]